jgi:hypothetical protein
MRTEKQITTGKREWQQLTTQRRVYMMPDFCQISLPLQNPGAEKAEWVRVNGNRTYTIHPMTIIDGDGRTIHRWAYGKIARLLIMWISTQVVRQKHQTNDRRIRLPRTLNELMDELGIRRRPTGADYRNFREQIAAISTFHMTITDATPDRLTGHSFTLADSWNLGWDPANRQAGGESGESYIKLTDETWRRMVHSTPLDAEMVEVFTTTGKGQDLDIYAWLTQRIYALNHSSAFQTPIITWDALSMQLGANYTRRDNFIARVRKSLDHIHMFWQFRYTIERGRGIRLYRSPMSVKPIPKPAETGGKAVVGNASEPLPDKTDRRRVQTATDRPTQAYHGTWDGYDDTDESEYMTVWRAPSVSGDPEPARNDV